MENISFLVRKIGLKIVSLRYLKPLNYSEWAASESHYGKKGSLKA